MRSRLAALGAAATLLTLTGCSGGEANASLPPVQVVEQPAASAGGACILWDYGFIRDAIGVTFTVAGSDQVDDTSTCVVQTENGDYPTLALSVVESTKADATLFLQDLMPAKATRVKGLGKAGYRLLSGASGGHGPGVEVTWLSEAAQLQTLKFTFAKGAKQAQVDQMSTKLVSLAKAMNTTKG
ncbi:hypothetical protein [Krasilnikovia sp. MM14-A1004]|uniref:hypothetical protein n=1 Tax=Krasilnikovia sp. MM14-A1004 TaxID=3373541 RepID=UPI00399C8D2A